MEHGEGLRRRATFEYDKRDSQELWELLGPFVVDHNITVEFSDAPLQSDFPLQTEAYNPELVSSFMHDEEQVDVVTWDSLKIVEEQLHWPKGVAERTANTLRRYASDESYVQTDKTLRSYLFITDEVGSSAGILAGRFGDLLDYLTTRGAVDKKGYKGFGNHQWSCYNMSKNNF